jgi:uncharacterized membrane protein YczE
MLSKMLLGPSQVLLLFWLICLQFQLSLLTAQLGQQLIYLLLSFFFGLSSPLSSQVPQVD